MDELEDLEYLVELSEAMKEEDAAVVALAVGDVFVGIVKHGLPDLGSL